MFDPVTSVFNSETFTHLIDKEVRKAERYQYFLSLLTIQIDRIHEHKDPAERNKMMSSVAGLLKEEIRNTDIIGQIDEERFGVALLHANRDDTVKVGERIRQLIENYMFNQAIQKHITVSMGAVCFPTHVWDISSLLRASEQMLSLAMDKGGNCILMPE